MGEESLFDILREERMNHALETALRDCVEYQEAEEEAEKRLDALLEKNLSEDQEEAVEECISAYNSSTAEYGRAAYRLGFQDGIRMLLEIHRAAKEEPGAAEKESDGE